MHKNFAIVLFLVKELRLMLKRKMLTKEPDEKWQFRKVLGFASFCSLSERRWLK